VRRPDEQARLDLVADKRRAAKNPAAKILVFGEVLTRLRAQPCLPTRKIGIVGEQIAVSNKILWLLHARSRRS
jgi:hypothetical protein